MDTSPDEFLDPRPDLDPAVLKRLGMILAGVVAVGLAAFLALRPSSTPPPVDIASDPLLVQGRTLFLDRCASCHGQQGKGDGPIAKTLKAGRAEDLTDLEWKFGDKPEQVVAIISKGTPGGEMPGWGGVLSPDDLKSVAGYIYYLAKAPVPEGLRAAKVDAGG